jgi:glycyl-tRNA synthetase beta chain
MSGHADFLVEIGTEELPPKALLRLSEAFTRGVLKGLADASLSASGHHSYATPRRLALLVRGLQTETAEQSVEKRGPPVRIAFNADGQPTRAAQAFAEGFKVEVEALERQSTPKGEWLVYRGTQPGQAAATLLPEIVKAALAALPIPKRMRWGAGEAEFVRPVHWIVMLLGDQVVDTELLGCVAGNSTRGHRFHSGGEITLTAPADYAQVLAEQGHVIADYAQRQARIAELVAAAAEHLGGQAIVERDVLEEVTALVEWPVPVSGRFDEEFLELPEEVLIATLQDHQRYFPVRDAAGKLRANFIAISNLESKDPSQVQAGNERVVRPRLADAVFFWSQDIKQTLSQRREALHQVVFEKDLGSLHDKSARVASLGHELAADMLHDKAFDQSVFQQWVVRAAHLAKTDLLTDMVGEYPELQGRMGYYYARHDGEPPAVAQAIEEQYLPRHAGDRLPASPVGAVLAVADRLDTLAGIFAAGKRPTGNKDPFGLRRSALGLLRILVEDHIELDLRDCVTRAIAMQPVRVEDPERLAEDVFAFINDRLRAYYLDGQAPDVGAVSSELFESVRARAPGSPLDFHQRLQAVQQFMRLDAADSLAQANKRIANILRTAEAEAETEIHSHLLKEPAEVRLHTALMHVADAHADRLVLRDYNGILLALASLREPVDRFFDDVMVMSDDLEARANRLALLRSLRALFLDVADLSLISR